MPLVIPLCDAADVRISNTNSGERFRCEGSGWQQVNYDELVPVYFDLTETDRAIIAGEILLALTIAYCFRILRKTIFN